MATNGRHYETSNATKKPSKYYFDGFYLINYTISAPL